MNVSSLWFGDTPHLYMLSEIFLEQFLECICVTRCRDQLALFLEHIVFELKEHFLQFIKSATTWKP